MEKKDLRLELLKLTFTHGRDVAEAVAKAKVMEEFCLEESVKKISEPQGKLENKASSKSKKKSDKLDSLL